ncbi:hypothetical protein AB0J83_26170 [Actinoplanes sp. NPDC049596]|uniref:hypothetical protein n=1 Tax=unclassified Actinoplanes TaxID=2626549 RepID=UPI0034242A0D
MSTETFALAGRRVVLFAGIYAALTVLVHVVTLAASAALRSGAADPNDVGTQASVLLFGSVTGLIALVCVLVLLISTIVWAVTAQRLGAGLTAYASVSLFAVLTALAYVLPQRMPTVATIVGTNLALRLTAAALLIAGVLTVRARIRRTTGEPTLGARRPLVTADDWDASKWDPTVMNEIDRRRRS